MADITCVFLGKRYTRYNKNWVDKNYITVTQLQHDLDREYYKTFNLDEMNAETLLSEGDICKEHKSVDVALLYYRRAISLADGKQLFGLFPKISSCYRQQGQPQKCIELYDEVKQAYGENLISDAFLTSIAAAYCDMQQYMEAKHFADRAYARAGGKASAELNGVYGRIRKETTGSGRYEK